MSDKIINFQQRRQLEQAIASFAEARNELAMAEIARQIVRTHSVEQVLPALIKHLDTTDSGVRGGLGHLAALLPSDDAIAALRSVAANPQHTPTARMTAMTITQRFLGIELPTTLISDLANTDNAAVQSLLEAIDEGKRNRHVLLEYVEQMRDLGEEIAFLVLDALAHAPPADRVELLRLIAQDIRPQVAQSALSRLEQLATGEASTAALRALYTLQFTLPDDRKAQIERTLRKLRMGGRRYDPPLAEGWRAVLSPAEPNGAQGLWLIHSPHAPATPGVLLGFVLNSAVGVLRFFGSETVDRSVLPPVQPVGGIFTVMSDNGGDAIVLETPFDYGRWLLAEALAAQQANASTLPLPGEYQLYNDRIWEFAPPFVEEVVQGYWQPQADVEVTEDLLERLQVEVDTLFAHPVMEKWALQQAAVVRAMAPGARPSAKLPVAETINVLLREIAKWPESAGLVSALEQGLRGQAGWLHFAGQAALAQSAVTLANAMKQLPLAQNPVLARMLVKGL